MNFEERPVNKEKTGGQAWLDFFGVASRWIVGVIFVYMGWTKAHDPEAFLKLLRQYDFTTYSLALNSLAGGLPWFEIICGLLILAGIAVRGTALLILLMLIAFTGVVLKRALTIADVQHIALCAVHFDCGCGNGEVFICRKVVDNALLMLMSAWLLTGFGQRFAIRFRLVH
jgi:uncharacterized membrane protein YphA (DoxX/SURF4 family)